ncbi:MAG: hypothetical protein V4693_23310 [Pseudomonadota bacterium]
MKRLGRENKGFFTQVPEELLLKVVRGWIELYQLTLKDLGSNFPRTSHSLDLSADGINWSERLNVNATGLLRIDSASRYAEFWAERSIRTLDKYRSFASRKQFVGSNAYSGYSNLVVRGEFLMLDRMANGVPSYDMFEAIVRERMRNEKHLKDIALANDWSIVACSETSIGELILLAEKIPQGLFNHDQQTLV